MVAADDDYQTNGNPGMSKATAAAQAVGGTVAVPDFGGTDQTGQQTSMICTQIAGLDAVRRCIEAAQVAPGSVWPRIPCHCPTLCPCAKPSMLT